jgi:hypothetical protein
MLEVAAVVGWLAHDFCKNARMGHAMFLFLHLVCFFLVMPALLVTVPLHLIYGVMRGRAPAGTAEVQDMGPRDNQAGLRNCPECREVVRTDAKRCKHCHAQIEPLLKVPD